VDPELETTAFVAFLFLEEEPEEFVV